MLDGTNYVVWKTQMTSFLQSKGLYKFITGRGKTLKINARAKRDNDALELLIEGDEKTLGHIKCYIAPSFLELVIKCDTALEAWKSLDTFFAGRETFNKFNLLEQLMDGQLKETGNPIVDVQEFLKDKTELVRRLEGVGFKVPDEILMAVILARLPESFDNMRRIFESQDNPTILKLNTELNKEAIRKQKRPRDEKSFYGKDDVPPPPKKPRIDKRKLKCNYCTKKGHEAEKCWLNPKSTNYRKEFVDRLRESAGTSNE